MHIEVTKQSGRKPRWKLLDDNGHVVPLRAGRVALPPTVEENRRVREAVDRVLSRMAADAEPVATT